MARRREARPVTSNVTRLPGFEEPPPPVDEMRVPEAPEEPNQNPISAATPHELPKGLTLAERQSRWLKERARFEASLETSSAGRE
jgi:hypothetical protein